MLLHRPRKEREGGEGEQYVTEVVKYDQNSKTVPVTSGGGDLKAKKQTKKRNIAAVIDQALSCIHYISAS